MKLYVIHVSVMSAKGVCIRSVVKLLSLDDQYIHDDEHKHRDPMRRHEYEYEYELGLTNPVV